MKKFMIERDVPGAGKLTPSELHAIAKKSCETIDEMKVQYHWVETFVTDNRLYCVHIAPDEETVRQHAIQGGFPISRIHEIKEIIDPTTATLNPDA